jgi:tryptophanyl-tRNA synthetase
MALNNIIPVGDDQAWKSEVEREITALKNQLAILTSQVNSRGK